MTRPEMLKFLQENCRELLGKECSHVNERYEITKIGLDAGECLEVVKAFEQRLRMSIPDDFLSGLQTVGQLLDVVEKCDRNRDYWAPERLAATP